MHAEILAFARMTAATGPALPHYPVTVTKVRVYDLAGAVHAEILAFARMTALWEVCCAAQAVTADASADDGCDGTCTAPTTPSP